MLETASLHERKQVREVPPLGSDGLGQSKGQIDGFSCVLLRLSPYAA